MVWINKTQLTSTSARHSHKTARAGYVSVRYKKGIKKMKHNYRTCNIKDCVECTELVEQGIVMACDECYSPGDSDSDGWQLMEDGRLLCLNCYKKEYEENTEQANPLDRQGAAVK